MKRKMTLDQYKRICFKKKQFLIPLSPIDSKAIISQTVTLAMNGCGPIVEPA